MNKPKYKLQANWIAGKFSPHCKFCRTGQTHSKSEHSASVRQFKQKVINRGKK